MAYSDESIQDMQQDALNRLREMQRRSKTVIEPQPDPVPESIASEAIAPMRQSMPQQNQQTDIFSGLLGNIGQDKLLLLLILYLLYKNKADMKLLLAIGYLLL